VAKIVGAAAAAVVVVTPVRSAAAIICNASCGLVANSISAGMRWPHTARSATQDRGG